VYKFGFRWRPDFHIGSGVKKTLILLVPTVFGAGVYQINVLVSQAIAWGLGDGAVSSLQYSSRLLELTLGIFAIALSTAILPSLSKNVAQKDIKSVQETLLYAIRLTCLVCLPATVGLFMVRTETVSLLFERGSFGSLSTAMTRDALAFHIVGLTFIALSRIVLQVFYAFQDTWRPFRVAVISMIVNLLGCFALAPILQQGGIALANSISAVVQVVALLFLLKNHIRLTIDPTTARSVLLSLVATTVMGVVVFALQSVFQTSQLNGFQDLLVPYSITVSLGVLSFGATCLLLRHPDIRDIVGLIKKRI